MQARYCPFPATSRCGRDERVGTAQIDGSCVGACEEEAESVGVLILGEPTRFDPIERAMDQKNHVI